MEKTRTKNNHSLVEISHPKMSLASTWTRSAAWTGGGEEGQKMDRGGTEVGRRCDEGGTDVGRRWDEGGTEVGQRWDGGRTEVGRRWDRCGT